MELLSLLSSSALNMHKTLTFAEMKCIYKIKYQKHFRWADTVAQCVYVYCRSAYVSMLVLCIYVRTYTYWTHMHLVGKPSSGDRSQQSARPVTQ